MNAGARPMRRERNEELRSRHFNRGSNIKWHGIEGGGAAVQRAVLEGVPAIQKRLETLLQDITPTLPRAVGISRRVRRGDTGDNLDIHAVNRGEVDRAWTSSRRTLRVSTGAIRIVVDIGGNASQNADAMQWRGIAAAALAHCIEKAGYNVEIVAAWAVSSYLRDARNGNNWALCTATVKGRSGKTDLGLMSSTVCLPGFFRLFGFVSLIRAADVQGIDADESLGYHADVSELMPVDPRVTTLTVPANVMNQQRATDWINSSLQLLQHSTGGK